MSDPAQVKIPDQTVLSSGSGFGGGNSQVNNGSGVQPVGGNQPQQTSSDDWDLPLNQIDDTDGVDEWGGAGTGEVGKDQFLPQEQPVGRVNKEYEPVGQSDGEASLIAEIERQRELGELGKEVKELVQEEHKENLQLKEKVIHENKVLVEPAGGSGLPQIVLPMTQSAMTQSLGGKTSLSASWLAAWCLRLIKKLRGRAVYASVMNNE